MSGETNVTVGLLRRYLEGLDEDELVLMQAIVNGRETFLQPVWSFRTGTHPHTGRRCAVLLVDWSMPGLYVAPKDPS